MLQQFRHNKYLCFSIMFTTRSWTPASVVVILALLLFILSFSQFPRIFDLLISAFEHDASSSLSHSARENTIRLRGRIPSLSSGKSDSRFNAGGSQTKRRGEQTKVHHNHTSDNPHRPSLRAHALVVDQVVYTKWHLDYGPGSSYIHDYSITIIERTIDNYGDAGTWVKQFNQNNTDNPIVMWSIKTSQLWAHREKFMYQSLDAQTGSTPMEYVMNGMVEPDDYGARPMTIYVCTDHQWNDLNGYNSWNSVEFAHIGIGPTAGHLFTEASSVTNENDARAWVLQQHDNNPIVMWEVRNNVLRYHREDVMYRIFDADGTGQSPLHYVTGTKNILSSRGESFSQGRTVRVRNDDWWTDLTSWTIVNGGDITIGIGSCFLGNNDDHISKIDTNFENEAEARAWVIGQYNEPNPIVMWQMKDGKLWYHREKFMGEIHSKKTPLEFVLNTKNFLERIAEDGGKVHVRNDSWWIELISTNSPTSKSSSPSATVPFNQPTSPNTSPLHITTDGDFCVVSIGAIAGIIVIATIAVGIYLCKKRSWGPFSSGESNGLCGKKRGENRVHEPPLPPAPTARDSLMSFSYDRDIENEMGVKDDFSLAQASQDPLFAEETSSRSMTSVITSELTTTKTLIGKKKHDVFFSHNWGKDEEGRDNHKRVLMLNEEFKKRKIGSTWFDEERMHGNIGDRMAQGIDDSLVVVVCITKNYISKVAGFGENGDNDNCKFEFEYALRRKGVENLIVIVMEEECKCPKAWSGPVGLVLGSHLYHMFFKDQNLTSCVDKLAEEIKRRKERTSSRPQIEYSRNTLVLTQCSSDSTHALARQGTAQTSPSIPFLEEIRHRKERTSSRTQMEFSCDKLTSLIHCSIIRHEWSERSIVSKISELSN